MLHRLTQDISGTAHVQGSNSWSLVKALGLKISDTNIQEALPLKKAPGLLVGLLLLLGGPESERPGPHSVLQNLQGFTNKPYI